jgi:hypothetical protein
MCQKRNDLSPITDAFTDLVVAIVRFGFERFEPDWLVHLRGTKFGLLTRRETADRLKMSLTTLNERRKQGLLLPVDEDGRVMYREPDVDNYIRRLKRME